MQPPEEILEVLKKAYQIEVDGYTFYAMTAEKAKKPAVKELFERLASDEIQHQIYLKDIMRNYESMGSSAFHTKAAAGDLTEFTKRVFTEQFRKQAQGAAFEMGVLSVGMTLETNAVRLFSSAAKDAAQGEMATFYQFLADWEKQHFDALQGLYQSVREDFWHAGGFSAF